MTGLIHDIRSAFRRSRLYPGPSLAVIATLALGIGANSAIFSLVDGAWLRPLAIKDPGHLVAIASVKDHAAADSERLDTSSSFSEFLDVREEVPALADVIGVDHRGVALDSSDGIQLLSAEVVTDNYFGFMGVGPELGHLPSESEIRRAQTPFIVLSHGTWKRVFAGDPNAIGRTIKLKGRTASIAAVLPAGFRGTERIMDPQVYVPRSTWMAWSPGEGTARTYRNYDLYARLRTGVSLDQARSQLQTLSSTMASEFPQANRGRTFAAKWEASGGNPMIKRLGILLLAVGIAILLIACTNIANLLLALQENRRREIAMRTALGARVLYLLRQLLIEYVGLAALGILAALALVKALISIVPSLIPDIGIPLVPDFRVDRRVLAFTITMAALSVLMCGVLPGLSSARISPLEAIRSQSVPCGKLRLPARKLFVAAQLAVSMTLLMITGMLVRALVRIQNIDLGFGSRQNAVILQFEVGRTGPAQLAEAGALVDHVKALPGVTGASISRIVPFALIGGGATKVVLSPGELPSPTAGTPV